MHRQTPEKQKPTQTAKTRTFLCESTVYKKTLCFWLATARTKACAGRHIKKASRFSRKAFAEREALRPAIFSDVRKCQKPCCLNGIFLTARNGDILQYRTIPQKRPKFVYKFVYAAKSGQFVYFTDHQTLSLPWLSVRPQSSRKVSLPKSHCDPSTS